MVFQKGNKINVGRKFSKERNIKISKTLKGRKQTEECKKRKSNSLKRYYKNNSNPKCGFRKGHKTNVKETEKRSCLNCKKIFEVTKLSKKKFCNRKCYHSYYSGDKNVSKRPDVRLKISKKLKSRIVTWNNSKTLKRLFKEGKLKPTFKGRKHTEKTKKLIRKKVKKAIKEGRIICNKGIHIWKNKQHPKGFLGHKHVEKSKEKMRKHLQGEKCHFWKGGISFLPYPIEFNGQLKHAIRVRDNFTCQLCDNIQNKRKLSIHHIDYNKKNTRINNLISLCLSCHGKVHHNENYWMNILKQKVQII